ncbi:SHOCT domain-containing protein [Cellulomonas sp. Marseille-Q8402]
MPGLLRGVARTAVVAGTATAVSGRVQRRQQGRWAAQEAQTAYQQPPPQQAYAPPAPAEQAGGVVDVRLDQLRQLAELRDQGVLTPAEFEAQKARILAS